MGNALMGEVEKLYENTWVDEPIRCYGFSEIKTETPFCGWALKILSLHLVDGHSRDLFSSFSCSETTL